MNPEDNYLEINRELWNNKTDTHLKSESPWFEPKRRSISTERVSSVVEALSLYLNDVFKRLMEKFNGLVSAPANERFVN